MNDTLEYGTNGSSINTFLVLDAAIISIQIILGLPVNSYVVWLILSGAGGTIASEFFYLNLTASVIVFCLASAFYIAMLFSYNFFLDLVCTFVIFFHYFSVPSFQCCICVERYMAVVHPVVFIRYKPLRYRVACSCVEWLMVLIFSVLTLWEEKACYILPGFYIVCISVVSFCCLAILRALKQPGPGEGQRDSGEGNDMKSRAFKIILISLIVMLLTIISYIPYVLSVEILDHSDHSVATLAMYTIGMMISVFVHPLLYIHKAGKLPCFKGL